MKRKICVFTGTRAEYGLLLPLMKEIKKDNELRLQTVISGMHLSPEFGLTYKEIEKDGISIHETVENLMSSDTPIGICKSTGLGLMGYGESLARLKPDIVIVLGDRFEALAFAIASIIARIPIAHIHGGELTQGSIDDSFRHAITKMSQFHFTSTELYRKRVIQLGEHPDRVFNVGALGIDNVKSMTLLSKQQLEKKLRFKFNKHNLLISFHPSTREKSTSSIQFKNLLKVLDERKETNILFTYTNADIDGRVINKMIDTYVLKNRDRAVAFPSLGQLYYLSAIQFVDAVVGNSSSGIIEAPSLKAATIDIGDRQKGRAKVESIIECDPTIESMRDAFKKLYSEEFQKILKGVVNIYGNGNTAKSIVRILKESDLSEITIKKGFYDIDYKI